jgi:hypothetical protein
LTPWQAEARVRARDAGMLSQATQVTAKEAK